MRRDLATAPGAYVAPTAAQAAIAADEYDVSCEPYYHRDPYMTPPQQDDLSTPACQPTAQESLPVQPPREQENLSSPAQSLKQQDSPQLPRQEADLSKQSNPSISQSVG
ncbi:hypothetical protein MTO96_033638 [Rhipicephalus appendiculatus]